MLVLISNAEHLLIDAASIVLALIAIRFAGRPARPPQLGVQAAGDPVRAGQRDHLLPLTV